MGSPPHDMPIDDEFEHVSQSLGKDDANHEHEDLEFVDMNKFEYLATRTTSLEEQVKSMNANLTQVTTLIQELMHNQALPTLSAQKVIEDDTKLPYLIRSHLNYPCHPLSFHMIQLIY